MLFFRDRRFSMRLFSNLFSASPPQFLLETKRFASIKDSSGFSVLCNLPETVKKIIRKMFCFLKGFRLRKFFFAGENGFRVLSVSFGYFWRCKIDKILTMSLLLFVLRMILLIWFSLQKFTTFFASVCEARLRLCA